MTILFKHILLNKTLWGLFLACGILLQPISKMAVLVHYACNVEYYATVLCENISKPEMKCKGTCKLRKELNSIDKSTDNGTKEGNTKRNEIQALPEFTLHQPFQYIPRFFQLRNVLWANNFLLNFNNSFREPIFHPPKDYSIFT
jgi:hypothetical protein